MPPDTPQRTHPGTPRSTRHSTRPDTRASTRRATAGSTGGHINCVVRRSKCVVYATPARARRENTCEPGDHWSSSTDNNDVVVDFEVQVPSGVEFNGQTVNGEMSAEGLKGDVRASTVNGSVRVTTTGLAEASTVNGSVYAQMGRADWNNDLEFSTVNGGITLILPGKLDTDVRATTVNGDIETDWPLMVSGRFSNRRLHGTIGAGGRGLNLSTVNGEIRLKKGT